MRLLYGLVWLLVFEPLALLLEAGGIAGFAAGLVCGALAMLWLLG